MMTSAAPDCNFLEEYLLDSDSLLKENNYPIHDEWPPTTDPYFFDPILMEEDFGLSDLEPMPSSSSDSGVSSGLSCEQPLTPMLPIEDDQIEFISNDNLSPQNFMDFDSMGSPNDSVGSVDSPMRSVTSSNVGSPVTDVTEEMEFDTKLVSAIDPAVVEGFIDVSASMTIKKEPLSTIKCEDVKPPIVKLETPITLKPVNPKRSNIRQLVRVTPVGSGNPRSILLPISLKDMKEVRTIKIINATQAKNLKGFKINQGNILTKAIPVNIKQEDTASEKSMHSSDEISETESPYPRLKLNNEEKRLLQKEGITLPSHYPLTKHEERELKRIRRKIRNKISAQDSRKRKKEYVDGLEDRVKQCTEDNMTLLKRIKALQTQNQSLAGQLKRVQALIQKGNKSAQPATCLMVLLVSLALVVLPNLNPHSSNSNELSGDQQQPDKNPPLAGNSRSLLHTKRFMDEEVLQCDEDLLGEVEGLLDHDYSPVVQVPFCKRPRYDCEQLPKYSLVSDGIFASPKIECSDINKLAKKYIEPPLDDVWPPPKPSDMPTAKVVDKLEELTNELKINISDADGMRTVFIKVPQEI